MGSKDVTTSEPQRYGEQEMAGRRDEAFKRALRTPLTHLRDYRDAEAIREAQRPTIHFVRSTTEVFRAHDGTGAHPTGFPVARTPITPRRSTWWPGRG